MSNPDRFPSEQTTLSLCGPAGRIEAVADVPAAAHARKAVAVICHPHPLHGGSLRNKVVTILERSLRELGAKTVRFNFRGVGDSEGAHDEGRGETLDLLAVAEWVRKVLPDHDLWLAGFSFGAYIALLGARHLPARLMVSVAPPAGRWDFAAVLPPNCPWLVVQGENDDVVAPQDVYDWIESLEEKPLLIRMEDTDHFFHRRLMDLRGALKNGVRKLLPSPAGVHG